MRSHKDLAITETQFPLLQGRRVGIGQDTLSEGACYPSSGGRSLVRCLIFFYVIGRGMSKKKKIPHPPSMLSS